MRIVGVIPARFGSTRLPGKPLHRILGKPLLQWVIEGARTSRSLSQVLVATDHPEIAALAESCGVAVEMTDPELPSGSDRAWAAIRHRPADVVVNIQGDEPLISGGLLDALTAPFHVEPELEMATLGQELRPGDLEASTTAKIVLNHRDEALYFSRHPIPYSRETPARVAGGCLKHIGLYAYRKDFLRRFCEQGPVAIERAEGLEQLRALYLGARLKVVRVDHESWGVDTPDDVKKIEGILKSRVNHG